MTPKNNKSPPSKCSVNRIPKKEADYTKFFNPKTNKMASGILIQCSLINTLEKSKLRISDMKNTKGHAFMTCTLSKGTEKIEIFVPEYKIAEYNYNIIEMLNDEKFQDEIGKIMNLIFFYISSVEIEYLALKKIQLFNKEKKKACQTAIF